jgi:galactokinase
LTEIGRFQGTCISWNVFVYTSDRNATPVMTHETILGDQSSALLERFDKLYGQPPLLVQAPGRINLIGEHTDYNEGFVFPAAIQFKTCIVIAKRSDRRVLVRSDNFDERIELDLDRLPPSARDHWSDYLVGVVRLLDQRLGKLPGANLLISGNVPQGAGLSSSAALEVAACTAFLLISEKRLPNVDVAQLCQRAENEFVGARCGIMDQFVSVHGERGHALYLDCRTLEHQLLPIPADVQLVICNTMIHHNHAAGEYNLRRAECEAATRFFASKLSDVKALRDVTLDIFEQLGQELPALIRKRCRHVITENLRVRQAAEALRVKDLARFGTFMARSHASLREDFEVSCAELDIMVRLAEQAEGVYGARMTGGGFGGCTINVVRADSVESFKGTIAQGYERATGIVPEIYVSSAADGAGRLVR